MKSKLKKSEVNPKNRPHRIVIKFQDALPLPYRSGEDIVEYLLKNKIIPVKEILQQFPGIKINKLFTSVEPDKITELVKKAQKINPGYNPPELLSYCTMDCPYEMDPGKVLQELTKSKHVEFAYIASKPAPSPCNTIGTNPMSMNQGYLDAAPKGINARYAWGFDGGCGAGSVQFIDIEYAWMLDHEDIKSADVSFLWGDKDYPDESEHGTAVLGIVLMQDNDDGGLGITPKVKSRLVSKVSPEGVDSIADAILKAISHLNFGDIVLLEVQVFDSQNIFRPAEIEKAVFDAIVLAVSTGIIVIEAAGNGNLARGFDLDEFTNSDGKAILNRESDDFRDSGAILIGAASDSVTASGTHGKARSSNYGNRIDCYSWGKNVFTADPGQTPPYRPDFSGTSSASAIIAGAVIAIQSIVETSGKPRLSPGEMRDIISNPSNGTGSRNKIGIMPDLKMIIDHAIPTLRP